MRDDARGAAISPDGSHILFYTPVTHDVMVMNADGEQAQVLVPGQKGNVLFTLTWSPDGQRFAYVHSQRVNQDFKHSIESRDANGGTPAVILADVDVRDLLWLPGNRLIYSAQEPSPHREDMNLWEVRLDAKSGAPDGKPRKLTDWPGFVFIKLSATSDGSHLTFINDHDQGDVYVAELDKNNKKFKAPARITLSEKHDWLGGWNSDSKSLFFYSNRNGNFDLYRQKVAERSADSIGTAAEEKRTPQLSPDGSWILYMSWPRMPNDAKPSSGRIMRMPVSGGPAEPPFNVQGYATWGPPGDVARNLGDVPGFRCPTTRGASRVLTESSDGDEKHLIITPFDPSQGKKGAPTKLEFPEDPEWALSPDGSQLAFTWFDTQSATVRIMQVGGGASHDISIKGLSELVGVAWASDGKSLFVIQNSSKGGLIYHVNFNGDSQTLFRGSWDIMQLAPSPDGHYLAYGAVNSNSNVWMIPSLPKP